MNFRPKRIQNQVIVITGASSGIGLRTAQMAAERGARVVLVARNEEALRKATDEINAKSKTKGGAIFIVADVADQGAVENVASEAISRFGRVDTWINNAGVGVWGLEEEIPIEEARRLFDTNFWGLVHGTRAAIRIMSQSGGHVLNMGSVESERALPLHSFYSASKHAIKGYTDAVRMEVEKQTLPIAVSLIKPASIDTPFVDHSRNYMADAAPRYMPSVYSVDVVARAILDCIESPRREITIGSSGRLIETLQSVAPRFLDLFMELTAFRQQRRDRSHGRAGSNFYHPTGDEGRTEGSHDGYVQKTSLTTSASLHRLRTIAVVVALSGIGYALYRGLGQSRNRPRPASDLDDLVEVGIYRGTAPEVSSYSLS